MYSRILPADPFIDCEFIINGVFQRNLPVYLYYASRIYADVYVKCSDSIYRQVFMYDNWPYLVHP